MQGYVEDGAFQFYFLLRVEYIAMIRSLRNILIRGCWHNAWNYGGIDYEIGRT